MITPHAISTSRSFTLCLGLAACFFATRIAHGFSGGDGSTENPFQVATAEHLDAVRNHPTNAFVQVANINLGVPPWNEGTGWVPIGTEAGREGGTAHFSGVYDGNGFRIISLTIDHDFDDGEEQGHWTTRPWGGLFDTVAEEGVVRNVTLDGGEIRGGYMYSAPLVGDNRGLIENCHASTVVFEAYEMVGGLVGDNTGTIRESSASGSVQGGSSVGGLAGGNLGLIENASASGDVQGENHSVGGLVRANEEGTIRQSHAFGAVSFYAVEENDYFNGIGGLVGDNIGGGVIESSYTAGEVNGVGNSEHPSSGTGGLVGNNMAQINNSYATGNVSGQERVGGLAGANEGQIERSRASGTIEGDNFVGGLVGRSSEGGILQSYAVGAVSGINNVGGLAGKARWSALIDGFARGSVTGAEMVGGLIGFAVETFIDRCYSTGPVSAEDEVSAGGLIGGVALGSPVFASYWNTETSGWNTSAAGEGRTTEQMTSPYDGTFSGWDFAEVWSEDEDGVINGGYPYIESEEFLFGFGSEAYPLLIQTATHLYNVRNYLGEENADKHFLMVADIDLYDATREGGVYANLTDSQGVEYDISTSFGQGDTVEYEGRNYVSLQNNNQGNLPANREFWHLCDNYGWEPIGSFGSPFPGHFDGNGHTINGVYINRPLAQWVGLFGGVQAGGKVKNLHLADADVTGVISVGSIAGGSYGLIINSHATGSVQASYHPWRNDTGGLVGISQGHILFCSFVGSVSGYHHIGGLVGANYGALAHDGPSSIESSFADVTVYGEGFCIGGLVGYSSHSALVQTSYSIGSVEGGAEVGGLVGHNHAGSTITNTYSHANVSGGAAVGGLTGDSDSMVFNSYSTGSVTGENAVGGLIGFGGYNVVNSYWNTETSGQEESFGGVGRTMAEMTYPHDAGTYADWDFDEIWAADTDGTVNSGYPYLQSLIQDTELLVNSSFDEPDGAGWELAEQALRSMVFEQPGIADLHVGGGFTGCVIWQDLDVPIAEGVTFDVLMRLSRGNAPDGNSTQIRLVYEDTEGQNHTLTVLEPGNSEVAFMPESTIFTASATLPADAVKLVTFCVYRADFGQFYAHEFSLKQAPLDTDPELVEYEEWVAAIPNPEQRGDHDAPAGDGIPNLLKFASGLDPMTAYTPTDVMTIYVPDNGAAAMGDMQVDMKREGPSSLPFSIVFYRSKTAAGVQVFAEHTTDLVSEDWGTEGITEKLIGEDSAREIWKATAPSGTRGFMRLKAVRD